MQKIPRRNFLALTGVAFVSPTLALGEDDPLKVIDHILLGCSDLDRGITFVEEQLGVRAAARRRSSRPQDSSDASSITLRFPRQTTRNSNSSAVCFASMSTSDVAEKPELQARITGPNRRVMQLNS